MIIHEILRLRHTIAGRQEGGKVDVRGRHLGESVEGHSRPGPHKLCIWEFPKIRGTLFWGPHNKDPII